MTETIVIITRELVPFHYGGIGVQFRLIASFLTAQGFRVVFISQHHDHFDKPVFQQYYPDCEIFFTESGLKNKAGVDFSPTGGLISHRDLVYASAVQEVFATMYQKYQPTFVLSADYRAEGFFCLLDKAAGHYQQSIFTIFIEGATYESIKTYETDMPHELPSELADPQNQVTCSMENLCVRLADSIISPTWIHWQSMKKRIKSIANPQVIPNFVDQAFFSHPPTSETRAQEKTMLFVGRLDYHKGADTLLQSYIQHYRTGPGKTPVPVLRLVGRDTFCKQYGMTFLQYWRDRIPEHLKSNIEFCGQVIPEKVRQYMAQATLCVFPSRWEVFGIVCLEAMASGRPVAVSSGTGLAEVVGDDLAQFQFDFSQPNEQVFLLLEHLHALEAEQYISLCRSFRNRAVQVVEQAHTALHHYFSKNQAAPAQRPQPAVAELVGDFGSCLQGMAGIASALAADFTALCSHYELSEADLKKLLHRHGTHASALQQHTNGPLSGFKHLLKRIIR